MKKIWKYILILMVACSIKQSVCKAQITLDTIVHPWNAIGFDFYLVQISDTETKYYFQDTISNTFSLYNMDFTPFLLNIPVPEPFAPSQYNFVVIYVSRTLFDCDSSNVEYAYVAIGSSVSGKTRPFYIMRTDGTQLFKRDSAFAPYFFGVLNGSQEIRPIQNTSSGAKLFLYYPSNTNNLYIYSLCGNLPSGMQEYDFSNLQKDYVTIFPNPTQTSLTFQIKFPNNLDEYEMVILDNTVQEVKRDKLNSGNKYSINVSDFSSGIYYYSLCTKNKVLQSGKFIITK